MEELLFLEFFEKHKLKNSSHCWNLKNRHIYRYCVLLQFSISPFGNDRNKLRFREVCDLLSVCITFSLFKNSPLIWKNGWRYHRVKSMPRRTSSYLAIGHISFNLIPGSRTSTLLTIKKYFESTNEVSLSLWHNKIFETWFNWLKCKPQLVPKSLRFLMPYALWIKDHSSAILTN